MSYQDEDFEEEGYFAEVDQGDPTGKDPKFYRLDGLNLPPAELQVMKVDDLFAEYIALRNQLTSDRQGWKSREAKVKQQMATIGAVLLNKSQELGVTSLSSDKGTGYQQTKERLVVAPDGWKDLTAWVKETGNFQVLQKRVSSDAVKEVREETGDLPPGVESTKELTFVVRSPTKNGRKA